MLLSEDIRRDYRAAETRGARLLPLSASRYLLQIPPIGALPDQPETARGIPHDRETSGVSGVSR
jgi:hypothetical protein